MQKRNANSEQKREIMQRIKLNLDRVVEECAYRISASI